MIDIQQDKILIKSGNRLDGVLEVPHKNPLKSLIIRGFSFSVKTYYISFKLCICTLG